MFNSVSSEIISLFLIVLVGWGIKKIGLLDTRMEIGLSDFVLNVSLPSMIIVSLYNTNLSPDMNFVLKMLGTATFSYAFMVVFAIFTAKLIKCEDKQRRILSFAMIFGNVANIGYPVIMAAYGSLGMMYATVFNLTFNVVLWTVGVRLLKKDFNEFTLKKILTPGLVSIIIGYAIYLLPVTIPGPVLQSLTKLGNTLAPLAMVMIGASLAGQSFKQIFANKIVWKLVAFKQLAMPILFFFVFRILLRDTTVVGIATLLVAMPTAVNSVAFALKYEADHHLAAQSVVVTTITSLMLFPVLIWFMKLF